MKWLVCGGRDLTDWRRVHATLDVAAEELGEPSIVIHGDCNGVDRHARDWATWRGIHAAAMPALWDAHGQAAGPRRNGAMLLLCPDVVIALPGGRGTADMVSQARAAGVRVIQAKEAT